MNRRVTTIGTYLHRRRSHFCVVSREMQIMQALLESSNLTKQERLFVFPTLLSRGKIYLRLVDDALSIVSTLRFICSVVLLHGDGKIEFCVDLLLVKSLSRKLDRTTLRDVNLLLDNVLLNIGWPALSRRDT